MHTLILHTLVLNAVVLRGGRAKLGPGQQGEGCDCGQSNRSVERLYRDLCAHRSTPHIAVLSARTSSGTPMSTRLSRFRLLKKNIPFLRSVLIWQRGIS